MKKAIAKKWVKALRSKKYKKTTSYLKSVKGRKNRFCVLGVLCDLYQKSHKNKIKETRVDLSEDYRRQGWDGIIFDGQDLKAMFPCPKLWGRLPKKVMKWAGVKNSSGKFLVKGKPIWLEVLNDRSIMSFKSLADMIEEFYEAI